MMYGGRKSDPGVVATKRANNVELSAAEPVEPRTGTKGNADSKARAGRRTGTVWHRHWPAYGMAEPAVRRQIPEVGAVCINVHVRICAGGAR